MSRSLSLRLALTSVLLCVGSCEGSDWDSQLALTVDCSEPLCGWQGPPEQLARTGSWHPTDYAFSLLGPTARITRTVSVSSNPDCLHFRYVGNIDETTQVRLLLDFNDDGSDDVEATLPSSRWTRQSVSLRAPADYSKLRISMAKVGLGAAQLALFSMEGDYSYSCGEGPPTKLQTGAACSLDATCSSERCLLGRCSACGPGGCAEGEACRDSSECMDGACAAQVCRACAKQGTCGDGEGCSVPGQCASQSCIAGSAPNLTQQPGLDATCGECDAAEDCGGKSCVLGRCAECAVDSDCSGGLVCRWLDGFDALERGCLPRPTSSLPRGALCESDAECAGNLPCSAGEGRAKRCGHACGKANDCRPEQVCAAPGARKVSEAPERFAKTSRWSELSGRIATCWPRVFGPQTCEVSAQCLGLGALQQSCCNGTCGGTADFDTGVCPSGARAL